MHYLYVLESDRQKSAWGKINVALYCRAMINELSSGLYLNSAAIAPLPVRSSGRKKMTKGPKRVSKDTSGLAQVHAASNKWIQPKKTREELDADMEEWNAARAEMNRAADNLNETT